MVKEHWRKDGTKVHIEPGIIPDIKELLEIPDDRALIGGVAVGVPVKDSALNTFERPRLPVDELTTWYGL